jgi:hypothetical protein
MPRQTSAQIDQRIAALPTEALACRTLGHAWPRGNAAKLYATSTRGGRMVEAEREMECTGGCGLVRVEQFETWSSGHIVRMGTPRYRYTKPYLIKRDDLTDTRPAIDRDEVQYLLLTTLYPDLPW